MTLVEQCSYCGHSVASNTNLYADRCYAGVSGPLKRLQHGAPFPEGDFVCGRCAEAPPKPPTLRWYTVGPWRVHTMLETVTLIHYQPEGFTLKDKGQDLFHQWLINVLDAAGAPTPRSGDAALNSREACSRRLAFWLYVRERDLEQVSANSQPAGVEP